MTEQHIAEFVVRSWGAWAPGLACPEDWRQWQQGKRDVGTENPPPPEVVPKTLQRRLSPLAKAVFNAVGQCIEEGEALPAVFSSSHGEIVRSLQMLEILQTGEELSPTAFSLSVHNAIAGLFSIVFKDRLEISVIAPGRDGMASGFLEALGLLQEGHSEVLLVYYDEPLPAFFPTAPFALNLSFPCALALRLALAGEGVQMQFGRSSFARHDGEQPLQLPAFIKFLVSESRRLESGNHDHGWQWLKK
ncbi:MAG: beta-ketoacyl synthase chain length factor [Methylomonas sp.]